MNAMILMVCSKDYRTRARQNKSAAARSTRFSPLAQRGSLPNPGKENEVKKKEESYRRGRGAFFIVPWSQDLEPRPQRVRVRISEADQVIGRLG
jgi:hypothetical protein